MESASSRETSDLEIIAACRAILYPSKPTFEGIPSYKSIKTALESATQGTMEYAHLYLLMILTKTSEYLKSGSDRNILMNWRYLDGFIKQLNASSFEKESRTTAFSELPPKGFVLSHEDTSLIIEAIIPSDLTKKTSERSTARTVIESPVVKILAGLVERYNSRKASALEGVASFTDSLDRMIDDGNVTGGVVSPPATRSHRRGESSLAAAGVVSLMSQPHLTK